MRKQKFDKQQDYTDPTLLRKALHQLLAQISKRDQKILWINSEKTAVLRMLVEKDQVLAEKDAILRYTQGQLNEILNSKAWKIAAWIQRMRLILVPSESRRAQILGRA